jgi:hypothetical protein
MPGKKPTCMLSWYARAHHEKWYNEKLKEEAEWEDKVEKEFLEAQAAETHLDNQRVSTANVSLE